MTARATAALMAGTVVLAWASALQAESRPADSGKTLRVTPVVRAYRKASPAVVNISTQRLIAMGPRLLGLRDDPFKDFGPSIFARKVPAINLGSGFLIHPGGYIVTNAHVVHRAQKITVTLADKSRYGAAVVAANPERDLAVLKMAATKDRKFRFLRLARSDDLMIGETVIAIGNPLGYQNTCTTGVVSALNRTLKFVGGTTYSGLIQTDAPINRGNSGGPLLNIAGELIGVTTAIRADAQGIGFAIPADSLLADLPKLVDFERLNRVVVGLGVKQAHGKDGEELLVASVAAGSPAAAAGCKKGDRLLAVNGQALAQLPDYLLAMLAAKAGAKVAIRCERDGREVNLAVLVRARPKPEGAALARRHFGLSVEAVTPELARLRRLPLEWGMFVTAVERGSPAARLGLRRGDVIFQLGRWYVTDLERLGAILEDVKPGQALQMGILRGNEGALTTIRARTIDTSPPAGRKART